MYSAKKSLFLESLRSQKLRYKRYTKSPLRYGGGKSLAVGFILEHIPTKYKKSDQPLYGRRECGDCLC
ncbi:DNA adenine methylase [Helicobacter heilmannii]|nr:DNA adenine methylase [Helicobacter heilmannii]